MVKWDGMDSGGTNGTLWYDPSPSIPSHGEVEWDGQWGQGVANGTLWYDSSPFIPSHGTVGWDGQLGQGVANGTLWYDPSLSIPSHGTVGWDGQWGHKWEGHFGTIPDHPKQHSLGFPMYHWMSVGNPGHVCHFSPDIAQLFITCNSGQ